MTGQGATQDDVRAALEASLGVARASLIRRLGDFDRGDEAAQAAAVVAIRAWTEKGVPDRPAAWLVRVGERRAIDALRRDAKRSALLDVAADHDAPVAPNLPAEGALIARDDALRLLFTCCHPALPPTSRVALALYAVGGLGVREVARAFCVSPDAMKRRLSRAKAQLRDAEIPFEVPRGDEVAPRLDAVLRTIYLLYTEAHSATEGEAHTRPILARWALRLSARAAEAMPEPEALGLHALLLLHEARHHARVDADGEIIPLDAQDRSLWDQARIDAGVRLVHDIIRSGRLGPFGIQACIASVHATAPSFDETPWEVIVGYYALLLRISPTPVVRLQHAIALGMRDGPDVALPTLRALSCVPELADAHAVFAARADFARRAGRMREADLAYADALARVRQGPERRFLERRRASLGESLP